LSRRDRRDYIAETPTSGGRAGGRLDARNKLSPVPRTDRTRTARVHVAAARGAKRTAAGHAVLRARRREIFVNYYYFCSGDGRVHSSMIK